MTALPQRRRRRTMVGAGAAVVLMVIAVVLVIVGASTVVNSKVGEVVEGETRPMLQLPLTDNAAVAVVDDDNQLTSLIIATLTPSGVGGSIVTVPVNTDASIGFGDVRQPFNEALNLADPESFFETVEGTLAISLRFGEIVGADRLAEFIDPLGPVTADLSADVIDSSLVGTGRISEAGERPMSSVSVVKALRAHDDSGESYDHHVLDVEVWSALAANAPVTSSDDVPTDEFDRPTAAATIDEVFERLWSGDVQVRDIALLPSLPNDDVDVVILDRADSLLVFAQISPARVSTPNQGLVFRVEVPLSDDQIDASGDIFDTRTELARTIIGELLFLSANVVSVDTAERPGGAAHVNRIEVADERFITDMRALVPVIFGESEVVVAPSLIDGVDVVLRLGTGYIDLKADQAGGAPAADGDTVQADG